MAGGSGDIFWCPLDRDLRPGPSSTSIDPRYGDTYHWMHGGSWDDYFIGYTIFAAWETAGVDWSNSGNSVTDGPPMGPATSPGQDVILADMIMSDTDYIDVHADETRNPATHRENNVGYSDGHVETHYHKLNHTGLYCHWDDHYVRQYNTYWLY